jgi:hypothetical protein
MITTTVTTDTTADSPMAPARSPQMRNRPTVRTSPIVLSQQGLCIVAAWNNARANTIRKINSQTRLSGVEDDSVEGTVNVPLRRSHDDETATGPATALSAHVAITTALSPYGHGRGIFDHTNYPVISSAHAFEVPESDVPAVSVRSPPSREVRHAGSGEGDS